jgi:hypothetical protein
LPAKKVSHGDTEVTESGPDAANVQRSPAFHSLQTPFEYEYEYRCTEYEYEEGKTQRDRAAQRSAPCPPCLRERILSIFYGRKCLTALPCSGEQKILIVVRRKKWLSLSRHDPIEHRSAD